MLQKSMASLAMCVDISATVKLENTSRNYINVRRKIAEDHRLRVRPIKWFMFQYVALTY